MTLSLALTDLSVTSPQGRSLLELRHLDVPAGSLLGVQGPSGAGKTTLLNALSGVISAQGKIRWGETDLTTLNEEQRARFRATHFGMIFQDYLLFEELSPLLNASLPALFSPSAQRDTIATNAAQRLKDFGISEERSSLLGYSGGERQRIAIARALATDPPVLLADEPTAALDRLAADTLTNDLTNLARTNGKTLIAVSHDEAFLNRMDRVITLHDGKLAEASA